MNWYVLQVCTGKEAETRDVLGQSGIHALAPMEQRVIRTGGNWIKRTYPLFVGYVFVLTAYDAKIHRQLRDTKNVIGILSCSGVPSPLTDEEASWIMTLADIEEPPIVAITDGGQFRVVDGALAPFYHKIIKLDKHRRRIRLRLTIGGHEITPELSVEIQREKDTKGAQVDSSLYAGSICTEHEHIGGNSCPNGEARSQPLTPL